MFKEKFFVTIGRLSPMLPAIRGRTRIFLILFNALGLRKHHVVVDTWLHRPTKYHAILDLHSWLERIAFLTGGYEDDLVPFLLALSKSMGRPGYLLDVGANIGLISVPFALLRKSEADARGAGLPLVVSFEAVSANFAALQRHARLNHLEHDMLLVHQALGDINATVEIQVEGDLREGEGTGTANILPQGSTHPCVRIPLEIKTLDELGERGLFPAGCTVMKIDTDGYDLKVLLGAQTLLRRDRPVIFGEFSAHCMNWHGQSIADVRSYAASLDYSVYRRVGRTWRFAREVQGLFEIDLLLVPNEKKAALNWCLTD